MNGQAIILTIHLKPCNVAVIQLASNGVLSTCQSQFLLSFSAWQALILDLNQSHRSQNSRLCHRLVSVSFSAGRYIQVNTAIVSSDLLLCEYAASTPYYGSFPPFSIYLSLCGVIVLFLALCVFSFPCLGHSVVKWRKKRKEK